MGAGSKYQIDMCHGPLLKKIIIFTVPLIAANLMAALFNSADMIVVGRFANAKALAAVGATSGLTMLVLNLFFGLSSGVSVLASRFIGSRDRQQLSKTVHTAMAVAIYGGVVMAIFSILISKPILKMMNTPVEILDKSALYMWIYCAGIPFVVIYAFGSSVLRATGDTRRPLYYMLFSGVLNVILNLFFVIVCKIDVAGVALATKIANLVSAVLVMRALHNADDATRFYWRKLKIDWNILKEMLRLGVPAGIQGSCFSISNIIIQKAINGFGTVVIAGNTAAMNIDGLVYMICVCFFHTSLNFTGQNYGAKKYYRIIRVVLLSACCTMVCGIMAGGSGLLFGKELLSIYSTEPDVINNGMLRMQIMMSTYFLCGIMDSISGTLRGLGYSFTPMITMILGICGFRIFWVQFILPYNPTLSMLISSYPISWIMIITVNGTILFFALRKLIRARKAAVKIPTAG